MEKTIFITGATGLIGGKLVARILTEDPSARIITLVRGRSVGEARERLLHVLGILSPEPDRADVLSRVRVACGDITGERLGLSGELYESLAQSVTHIIHCAASVQFDIPIGCAREVNFSGTKNVLAFAMRAKSAGHLRRVAHVSTAYVCGDRDGIIDEDDFTEDPVFSNSYEQTKWETERWVRSQMDSLPIAIFRPSIVVGDSRTGATTAFNVLYIPLSFISRGLLTALPCAEDVPLDVVPVDYVANAINHIFFHHDRCEGKTFHITSGSGNTLTAREITKRAVELFNRENSDRQLASITFAPEVLQAGGRELPAAFRRTLTLMKPFLPYIGVSRSFDTTNTESALAGSGIRPPRISAYLDTILTFALHANWGRRVRKAA